MGKKCQFITDMLNISFINIDQIFTIFIDSP